jgi:hypothetical protein
VRWGGGGPGAGAPAELLVFRVAGTSAHGRGGGGEDELIARAGLDCLRASAPIVFAAQMLGGGDALRLRACGAPATAPSQPAAAAVPAAAVQCGAGHAAWVSGYAVGGYEGGWVCNGCAAAGRDRRCAGAQSGMGEGWGKMGERWRERWERDGVEIEKDGREMGDKGTKGGRWRERWGRDGGEMEER